jgi:hypothetical protein
MAFFDGNLWKSTAKKLEWHHRDNFLQFDFAHTVNWLDEGGTTYEFLDFLAQPGGDAVDTYADEDHSLVKYTIDQSPSTLITMFQSNTLVTGDEYLFLAECGIHGTDGLTAEGRNGNRVTIAYNGTTIATCDFTETLMTVGTQGERLAGYNIITAGAGGEVTVVGESPGYASPNIEVGAGMASVWAINMTKIRAANYAESAGGGAYTPTTAAYTTGGASLALPDADGVEDYILIYQMKGDCDSRFTQLWVALTGGPWTGDEEIWTHSPEHSYDASYVPGSQRQTMGMMILEAPAAGTTISMRCKRETTSVGPEANLVSSSMIAIKLSAFAEYYTSFTLDDANAPGNAAEKRIHTINFTTLSATGTEWLYLGGFHDYYPSSGFWAAAEINEDVNSGGDVVVSGNQAALADGDTTFRQPQATFPRSGTPTTLDVSDSVEATYDVLPAPNSAGEEWGSSSMAAIALLTGTQESFTVGNTTWKTLIQGLTIELTDPTTISSTLNVTGATDLDSTLNVDGVADFNANVDINNATLTIYDSSGSDSLAMSHDDTDFLFAFTQTQQALFTGVTASYQFDETVAIVKSGSSSFSVNDTSGSAITAQLFPASLQQSGAGAGDFFFTGMDTLRLLGGKEFHLVDSTSSDWLAMSHNGTDVDFDYQNTTNHNFNDGVVVKIWDSTDADSVAFAHDGTDLNTTFPDGTTTDWNISGITAIQAGTVDADFDAITGTSVLVDNDANVGRSLFVTEASDDQADTAGDGQFWVQDAVPNSPRFTNDTGSKFALNNVLEAAYSFDTVTASADPGAGDVRFDNATPASVTNLYISDTDDLGKDYSWILDNLATDDLITIKSESDDADYAVFAVSGTPTDNTGWWTIPVTVINSGTLPAEQDQIRIGVQKISSMSTVLSFNDLSDTGTNFTWDGSKVQIVDGTTWSTDGLHVDLTNQAGFLGDDFGIKIYAGGGRYIAYWDDTGLVGQHQTSTPYIVMDNAVSRTDPGYAFRGDSSSGIGQDSGGGEVSIIATGVEQARFDVTGNHLINSLLDAATGNEIALDLNYTTNKATSGDDTGLRINATDTASPGTSLFAEFVVGGVTKFSWSTNPTFKIYDDTGVDSAAFSHDGTDFNTTFPDGTTTDWNISGITAIQAGTVDADFDAITATSYGGITEANLLDLSATETVSGDWTFSGSVDLTGARIGLKETASVNAVVEYQDTDGTILGNVGFARGTNEFFTGTAQNDLAIESIFGEIVFATNNTERMAIANGGAVLIKNSAGGEMLTLQDTGGAGDAAAYWLQFDDSAGTRQAYIGYGSGSNSDLAINNDVHGGDVIINAENATGTNLEMARFNPDGDITFTGPSAFDVRLLGGLGLEIFDSSSIGKAQMSHDGTDFNFVFTSTTTMRLENPNGGAMLELKDSGGAGDVANPYITYYDSASTRLAWMGFGSGSTSDWSVTVDDVDGDIQLIPGTTSGWVRVLNGSDWMQMRHDGTDFNFEGVNTTDFNFDKPVTSQSNYLLEGYTGQRNVLRCLCIRIDPGSTPGTNYNITFDSVRSWNVATPTNATNMTASTTNGSFTSNANSRILTFDDYSNVIAVISSDMLYSDANNSTQDLTVDAYPSSSQLDWSLVATPGSVTQNHATMTSNSGDFVIVRFIFITNA